MTARAGSAPTRILLLDREPPTTWEMARGLPQNAGAWVLAHARSVADVQRALKKGGVDVLLVDLGHAAAERSELLAETKQQFPEIVRLALADAGDAGAGVEVLSLVHQVVARPGQTGDLAELLARIRFLTTLMSNARLRAAVGDIAALPVVPPIYAELTRVLGNPGVDMREIGRVVGRDPALTAKILQIVNSALLGLSRRISNVEEAVVYVGMNLIRHVVLLHEVFSVVEKQTRVGELSTPALQQHSFLSATLASRIIPQRSMANEAFTAALLHDVGELLFAMKFPGQAKPIRVAAAGEGVAAALLEEKRCGVTHAELGAYLLGLWGLPTPVVEAVALHHDPAGASKSAAAIAAAVHVAEHLAYEVAPSSYGLAADIEDSMDLAYLASTGMLAQLPAWRRLAVDMAQSNRG